MLLPRIGPALVRNAKAAALNQVRASGTLVFTEASIKPATVGGQTPGPDGPGAHGTKTREDFAKVWPRRYRLQEHHLNELKKNHTPVHLSGPQDKYVIPAFSIYISLVALFSCYQTLSL